ncbi:protein kinase subdomain-containing protein PKL CAK Fmp29 [Suillus paluster]|uniref:protein kinase subdomain-containing protein PKL CAK Fmp29 n=1 Tax=Suillus paluster TaxID=48578 RepID=UPI001B8716F2|nr:protein kinase subdomain-containing protein PKL CAK Fmp29 [Suillus paluster]KAG1752656.1 protein kinase subdomain-containing protein PKL CAK Fmp29 [Suillus paluster]
MAHLRSDFFEYTSGRWIFNDDLRHAERRRVFKVDELSRLAAEAVNRSPDDIVRLEKLAEGGFNRTFLITMRCGFRMVARIPYPAMIPKYFAFASEVATMALLRSFGLPIPEVYGYSPTPNNAAGTEYIFMEFVQGTNLSDIWFDLGEGEIISISRQLAELESKMMSIAFPAGGSLYYTEDLENAAGSTSWPTRPGITLEDKRFCVGPDTSLRLWYGRRSQLDLDRGPYESAEAALVRGAENELAYLRRFGRPLLPFQRVRREAYKYQEQPPSDHIENLDRYLLIASSLIPRNPSLGHFRIRHPDLQPSNIIVSRSPDSNLHVVGLIDWQHTSILPLFLLTGIPQQLQNYDDIGSQSMMRPSLPEKLDDLDETQQSGEMELYRRRLVHYHYVKNTEEYNELHYAALTNPMGVLRRRLFCHASDPWEGETLALKVALIQATENWKTLTGGGPPCPVVFDPDDVRETMKLDAEQKEADESLEACRDVIGFGPEGWVPAEHYEEAMALSKKLKEDGLAAAESEERAQIAAHWPLDDMDEEEYDFV